MKIIGRITFVVFITSLVLFAMGDNMKKESKSKEAIKDIEKSGWYSDACKNIEKREYSIKRTAGDKEQYESTNLAQNIRFYFDEKGFEAEPREDKENWTVRIDFEGYGRKEIIENKVTEKNAEKNELRMKNEELTVEYKNEKKGMTQDFIIERRMDGEGSYDLTFKVGGDTDYEVSDDGIKFSKNKNVVMEYNDLYVYDSRKKELKSEFEKTDEGFKIKIDDAGAVYPITIDPLSSSPDWTGEPNQASAYYGISVSTAGDVNGDGYDDVIAGASTYDNGQANEGIAFVYYGSPSGLSTTADWTGEENQASSYYGGSVSTAGDVNGDGYDDVIVGAYSYDNGQTDEGAAFVYYGSSTGLSTTAGWSGESNQATAYYGRSVSTAGDINGDGYDDVIVGAYDYDNGESNEGIAFVYYGSSSGLSTTAGWTGESNQAIATYGISVSTAGDVNGDGYSDVIVSANDYDNGQTDEGAAFVYYGSSTGLSITAGWTGEANQAYADYGSSVSTAGDVNGDGYSDVIVGALSYDNGQSNEGRAFIYYGSSSGLSTTADWTNESNQADAVFGYSVSTAGDVNGDGYDDVIVGARHYDNGETDEGGAFVYYGSSTGLSANPIWTGESNQADADYGISVSTAGDVNGDGYSDVIAGAFLYDNGESDEGRAFAYYGDLTLMKSVSSYDFSSLEINHEYSKDGIYLKNMEIVSLSVDSVSYTNARFYTDSGIIFPTSINANDSFVFAVNAFSADTAHATSKMYIHFTLSGNSYTDSISLSAFFTVPLLIDSAKAFDGANIIPGMDEDDYVMLYFNQNTNKAGVNALNLDDVLTLSDGHTWLDGFGEIDTSYWNTAGNRFTVFFSTFNSNPTIMVGDTIYTDSSTISSSLSGLKCHYPVVLTGSFGIDATDPTAFNLLAPTGNISDNTPTYIWTESNDAYFKSYELYLNDSLIATSTDTAYTTVSALVDGQHYWNVIAYDSTDNTRQSNQTDTFYLDATKPSAAILVSPADSSTVSSSIFTWNASTDNFSGIKNYELLYDDDSMFGSPLIQTTTDTTYTAVLSQQKYYWRVRATDNFDNIGDWSTEWSFTYQLTGISEKFMNDIKKTDQTGMYVTFNEIRYTIISNENRFAVYDITGKVIYEKSNNGTGMHAYLKENLSSGIYFIRFRDGENEINRKMLIVR